jgi:hypothetical protein
MLVHPAEVQSYSREDFFGDSGKVTGLIATMPEEL